MAGCNIPRPAVGYLIVCDNMVKYMISPEQTAGLMPQGATRLPGQPGIIYLQINPPQTGIHGVIAMNYPVLRDLSDTIYNAIQKSRTPFTDDLLRIVIILASALVAMSAIEFIVRKVLANSSNRDEIVQTMGFLFVIIRYSLLLVCGYLAIRACISEITHMEANNIRDVILWLHMDTVTLFDYSVKILISLVIFLAFNALQNKLIKVLKRHLEKRDVNERFSNILINIVKYTLLIFYIVSTSLQLMITGGDNIVALAIYIYLCVIIAVPFKRIQASFSGKSPGMDKLMSLVSWTSGAIMLVAVVIGIFNGISYLLHSGGTDITTWLSSPERVLEDQLKTYFLLDQSLTSTIKAENGVEAKLTVESDGELNIIYLNGKQVGINTSGRKYQFYNVAINQPEINAVRDTHYVYDDYWESVGNLEQAVSRTHYYYNNKNNDCLAMTVNLYSNRIVNLTYYSNYQFILPYLKAGEGL